MLFGEAKLRQQRRGGWSVRLPTGVFARDLPLRVTRERDRLRITCPRAIGIPPPWDGGRNRQPRGPPLRQSLLTLWALGVVVAFVSVPLPCECQKSFWRSSAAAHNLAYSHSFYTALHEQNTEII